MKFRLVTKTLRLRKKDDVLDAGCGIGIFLQGYSDRYGLSGCGVDIDCSRVAIAKKVNGFLEQNNLFKVSRLEKLNLGTRKFDKIICVDVLEHIKEDSLALKNMNRCLKSGGTMIVTVPMSPYEVNTYQRPIEKFGHVRRGYSYRELVKLAKAAGFTKIKVKTYFCLFSVYAVRVQQYLYKKVPFYVNVLFSPILTLATLLDDFTKISPREYALIVRK
jgi:2-polyprenyl-3-methyl-5-hydroxy-6-metoxy-1,4-benzoquinol methylase